MVGEERGREGGMERGRHQYWESYLFLVFPYGARDQTEDIVHFG